MRSPVRMRFATNFALKRSSDVCLDGAPSATAPVPRVPGGGTAHAVARQHPCNAPHFPLQRANARATARAETPRTLKTSGLSAIKPPKNETPKARGFGGLPRLLMRDLCLTAAAAQTGGEAGPDPPDIFRCRRGAFPCQPTQNPSHSLGVRVG